MIKKPSSDELQEVLLDEAYNIDPIVHDSRHVMRKLLCVLFLAGLFMAIEIVGGLLANSIAILSDAAHMLSDLLGFVISIISIYISGLPANTKHSFGYHRAGVIGALASIMVIWALTGFLIYFAVRRVINIDEVEVEGPLMFGVACFGLLTNLVMIKVLHGGEGHGHAHGHGSSHGHDHGHGHSHSEGHAHSHSHTRGIASKHVHEHKHGEEHAHDLEHEHKHDHDHDHDHEHGEHKHDHEHDHEHKHEHEHEHEHEHKHGEEHAHDLEHEHKHDHDHDHEHKHDHDHEHKHDHEHEHEHGHEEEKTAVAISIRKNEEGEIEVRKGKNLSVTSDTDNLNVRATIIHILGDILQSIGVIIASILVWISPDKLKIADPIVTFIFAIIVLYTTIRVAKDCIFVLMEGTPAELDMEEFEHTLRGIEGVVEVHDLHVWSLGVGKPSMSGHIYASRDTGAVLKRATKICRDYGIFHSTIQVETTQDKKHIDYIECVHNIH